MCGITGFLGWQKTASEMTQQVRRMVATLEHRGPDDAGLWLDPGAGVALGHRRLSIIDPSSVGRQPMHSAGGRYVIVFNGEIYNFHCLRRELESLGHNFRGHSDTEVLLAAFEQWGVDDSLPRLNGMFAFAVWDCQLRQLQLARDRLGEKPLYYGWTGGTLLFGSELKALQVHPSFNPLVDHDAVALYLRLGYVPAPYSIYKGIRQLAPAMSVQFGMSRIPASPGPQPYWSARDVAKHADEEPFRGPESQALAELDRIASEAVRLRMVADVPLGAFLSGGIDSSTVVALMQAQSTRAVKTFTIGFAEREFNEAESAAAVARHLGTNHTELCLTPAELMELIPRLPLMYDEPFADSSQIPTHAVCLMARKCVTVALSGDGGDEIFAGYVKYSFWSAAWRNASRQPHLLRHLLATVLNSLSPAAWDAMIAGVSSVLPRQWKLVRRPGEKLQILASLLKARDFLDWHCEFGSQWKTSTLRMYNGDHAPLLEGDIHLREDSSDVTRRMMLHDLLTYLPGDLLVKVDRASMAIGLETRAPFLDPNLISFAARLPLSMLVNRWQGKLLLRKLLYKYVPQELVNRPKRGFSIPLGDWLRGPLRHWAEELLSERRLKNDGFFAVKAIRAAWEAHLSGHQDLSNKLWTILMFQSWLDAVKSVNLGSRQVSMQGLFQSHEEFSSTGGAVANTALFGISERVT